VVVVVITCDCASGVCATTELAGANRATHKRAITQLSDWIANPDREVLGFINFLRSFSIPFVGLLTGCSSSTLQNSLQGKAEFQIAMSGVAAAPVEIGSLLFRDFIFLCFVDFVQRAGAV